MTTVSELIALLKTEKQDETVLFQYITKEMYESCYDAISDKQWEARVARVDDSDFPDVASDLFFSWLSDDEEDDDPLHGEDEEEEAA